MYVLNVYRPPRGNVDNFTKIQQAAIATIRIYGNDSEVFLGGDINVDMLHPNSTNAKKIQKFMKICQVKQLIQKVTRPDSNSCLDLIFYGL